MRNPSNISSLKTMPLCTNTRKAIRYEETLLPVQVIGYTLDNKEFRESTQTQNFSAGGVRMVLKTIVQRGSILYLSLPLPSRLRHYDWSEELYHIFVEVKFTKRLVTGGCAIGVSFMGKNPPEGVEFFPGIASPPR